MADDFFTLRLMLIIVFPQELEKLCVGPANLSAAGMTAKVKISFI